MRRSAYDWCRIIHEVKRATKMTDEDIAGRLNLDASTIRNWRNNNRCPRYDDGEYLMTLYRQYRGEPPRRA